jgi:hypothetical protein
VNSTGEIQVPKKSAPKLTITFALSKLYEGTTSFPKAILLASIKAEYEIAS